jgi:hypothetical protein
MRLAVWPASIASAAQAADRLRPGCASLVNGVLPIVVLGEVPRGEAMHCRRPAEGTALSNQAFALYVVACG